MRQQIWFVLLNNFKINRAVKMNFHVFIFLMPPAISFSISRLYNISTLLPKKNFALLYFCC